jgi:hypothetical protein
MVEVGEDSGAFRWREVFRVECVIGEGEGSGVEVVLDMFPVCDGADRDAEELFAVHGGGEIR